MESVGQLASGLASLMRIVFFLLVAIVVVWLGWRNRERLNALWQQLLDEWRQFWDRLWGRSIQSGPQQTSGEGPATPPVRRFAEFADPFATGVARQMRPSELTQYTFAALEAWANDHGCPRAGQQTPLEFAQSLAATQGDVATEARSVAQWYCQLAYAGSELPETCLPSLRRLWERLRA